MTRSTFSTAVMAVLLLPTFALAEPVEDVVTDTAEAVISDTDAVGSTEAAVAVDVPPDLADIEPSDAELLQSIAEDLESAPDIVTSATEVPPAKVQATAGSGIVLGPRGVDDEGRVGRLHTVTRGNTLWDLSAAYLGTPWVWPSVWTDNDDIANPHLINPGDKIWITANEMRVVTAEEAEAFVATAAEMAAAPVTPEAEAPVAAFDGADEPSTLEAFPVAVPGMRTQSASRGRRVTVVQREAMGFMSADEFEGASSIVDSAVERTFLAQGDEVVIGVGEGDVEAGDQFMIFQVIEEVRDPESLRLIGHHVDPLGWLEVTTLTGDTSIAEIRTSYSEIARGVQVVRREPAPQSVEVRSTPDVIEGKVIFLPSDQTMMADGGYVYIDRGEFHGVEVGSELEAFDSGVIVNDWPRDADVRTPDNVVAKLVVVSVQPDSSVAFVLWSNRELEVGDGVRPRIPTLAQR